MNIELNPQQKSILLDLCFTQIFQLGESDHEGAEDMISDINSFMVETGLFMKPEDVIFDNDGVPIIIWPDANYEPLYTRDYSENVEDDDCEDLEH